MDDSKKLLTKLFSITEGPDDKNNMTEMFGALLTEDTMYSLIHTLSDHKKRKLKDKWEKNETNPAALIGMINKLFPKEQIDETFAKVSERAIFDYLNMVEPRLSRQQKDELFKLSEELEPSGVRKAIKEHAAYRRNLKD